MKVFKFGGASVNSVDRIHQMAAIVEAYKNEKLLIIISAMGKTTNALEKVAEAFFDDRKEDALQLFQQVKVQHLQTAKYLLVTTYLACEKQLNDFFTEVEWLLHDKPVREYDYYYDQLVCVGELMSTTIIHHFLNEKNSQNSWIDVRDIIRTDDNFREAIIDWEYTQQAVTEKILPLFTKETIVLTQGFIGATDENESTTLGREGSDYTAAVFANLLEAESQTIWKDVESVMNADPKQFPDAIPIPELNYNEIIEMAYYGAQVIHPKTIKPLQNKNIPLFVKCFLNPKLPGTIIHNQQLKELPPVVVLKEKQILVTFTSRDFSFMGDSHVKHIYQLMEDLKISPNITQNGAISLFCVLDDFSDKVEKLAEGAATFVDVQLTRELSLLTIRHYTKDVFEKLVGKEKKILLRQQTPETIQVLMA